MQYEKLRVWKFSFELTKQIYRQSEQWKDYALKDQIRRASVSIVSNIAEGEERQTLKESIRFLYIAKGSAGEVLTQLMLAREFGYIEENVSYKYELLVRDISKMLAGLITSRTKKINE
ncbi:four helix bundle protein [Vibrio gangliei]|uniref:four helix bundle protein n=1 Tax=Vibrio gangliei TaxID=2077090 RepID=UPI000D01B220|nr:four helix bundle protein [Vibrio gangliei]